MQLNDTRFCNFSFIYIFTENQSPDSKHATKVDFRWEILPWGNSPSIVFKTLPDI